MSATLIFPKNIKRVIVEKLENKINQQYESFEEFSFCV